MRESERERERGKRYTFLLTYLRTDTNISVLTNNIVKLEKGANPTVVKYIEPGT